MNHKKNKFTAKVRQQGNTLLIYVPVKNRDDFVYGQDVLVRKIRREEIIHEVK